MCTAPTPVLIGGMRSLTSGGRVVCVVLLAAAVGCPAARAAAPYPSIPLPLGGTPTMLRADDVASVGNVGAVWAGRSGALLQLAPTPS